MFKILFCNHYLNPLNTFMRKGKDLNPYLWLTDPDTNPGGPKTYGSYGPGSGSGSGTQVYFYFFFSVPMFSKCRHQYFLVFGIWHHLCSVQVPVFYDDQYRTVPIIPSVRCHYFPILMVLFSVSVPGFPHPFSMGYLVNPYAAYANGSQLVSTCIL